MRTGTIAPAAQRRSNESESATRARPQTVTRTPVLQPLEPREPSPDRPPTTRERLEAAFAVAPRPDQAPELAEEHAAEAPAGPDPPAAEPVEVVESEVPSPTRERIVQQALAAAAAEAREPAPAVAAPAARAPEPPAPAVLEHEPELEAEESAGLAAAADVAKQPVAARAAHARPEEHEPAGPAEPRATPEPPLHAVTEPAPPVAFPAVEAPASEVEAVARGPPPAPALIPVIQTKLSVSRPGDALEREADAVAARVVRGGAPAPARGPPLQRSAPVRGPPAAGSGTLTRNVASVVSAPGGGGMLDPAVRARIEPHLGVDLGHVRVRRGPDAAAAARDLQARAFTSGSTIFLAAESSPADLALMAHEATHVAQQQTVAAARTTLLRDATDYLPDVSVDDLVPDWILDGVRSAVRSIPGYTLLTYITGEDPLTEERVTVSQEELIETLLTYGPFGAAVGQVLQAIDVLGDIFTFVTEGLEANDLTLARIARDIEAAWEELSVTNGIAGNVAIVRRYVDAFLRDVGSFVDSIVDRVLEIVRAVVAEVAEPLLETPAIAPIWNLTKKVLHYDPLRGEEVQAPTAEIIADFLRLIGQEQRLAQMEERGTLQETADWLDTQLVIFLSLVLELGMLFNDAWEAIQPQNLPDLFTNLEELAQRAFGLVQRVAEFAATLILKILELVKNALLGWLSEHAHTIPGFHLLTVILEENPFTGEQVLRTAQNLIKGFITLMPGGEETYEQLAESGVITEAAERIEGEMTRLGISLELITGIFLGIWDTLSLDDLLDPVGAFTRILDLFGEPLSRLIRFIAVVIEVVITLVLRLMNFPSDLLGSIIANTLQAIADIRRDPVGFLLNMLEAVKLGFTGFFDNILTYLAQGLAAWLFRGLGQLGITIPSDLSLQSILQLVLQVLGITVESLWTKLGEHIGPERVEMIRGALDQLAGAWQFIKDVQEGGIGAVWTYVTDQLSGLWDTLLDMAKDWIITTIVERVAVRLLSLLDPTGVMAVVNSFIAFFAAVQSAIEYLREILEIVNRYVTTFAQVAAGNIVPGAQMLEQGLASAIPVAIGFLANQVGLGNIPEKIVEIIGRLRELVDQALDWLIGQAVRLGQAALNALGLGPETEEEPAAEAAEPAAPPPGVAGLLQVDEGVSLDDGSHRIQSQADPAQLVLNSDPVLLSTVPNPALQALYQRYVQVVATFTANLAQFDDPQRAAELGGTAEQAPSGARLGKGAVDAAVTAIKEWVDANGVPPTDAPGLGDVRPYAQQHERFANIPVWRLEAEHVIPNGYFNALLEGMRLRRIEHSGEYRQMSTLMIYERAAEWKTSGAGADEGDATIMRRINAWASRYFAELHADPDESEPGENVRHLLGRFETHVADAEARTLRQVDTEQRQNGAQRGHAPGSLTRDFFAPKVADVNGRQLRLFAVVLEDRLEESVGAGRTGF